MYIAAAGAAGSWGCSIATVEHQTVTNGGGGKHIFSVNSQDMNGKMSHIIKHYQEKSIDYRGVHTVILMHIGLAILIGRLI